jgi:hypothetical protein
VKKEYGDLGKSRIKLIVKEEEKVLAILEEKIRKVMKTDSTKKDFLKESTTGKNLYNPIKKHIYFKTSYIYLKKLMSKYNIKSRYVYVESSCFT